MKVKARVVITPDKVVVGEKIIIFESSGADLLVEIYKKKVGNYPKFFKMDPLARLGFIGCTRCTRENQRTARGQHAGGDHDEGGGGKLEGEGGVLHVHLS